MDTETKGVGDVKSTQRGTAARYNAGKPDVSMMPLRVVAAMLDHTGAPSSVVKAMYCLGHYQESHEVHHLYSAAQALGATGTIRDTCKTFTYGAKKYAPFNWMKGMAWSIPLACAARHLLAMADGEENDPESGEPHRGHFGANITMLICYKVIYPEGNDLPPVGTLTGGAKS